jgi:hypothetical protein
LGQALSAHDLTHILFQTFDGLPVSGGSWFADRISYVDSVAYVGVIAVVLAAVAVAVRRRNPIVVAFAAMTVCMASLVFIPPVVWVADHLPLIGTFLWNRAVIPMAFGAAVLAGFGTNLLVRQDRARTVRFWFALGFGVVAIALAALWLFGRGQLPTAEAAVRAHSFLWPVGCTAFGLTAAGLLWSVYSRRRKAFHEPLDGLGRWVAGGLLALQTAFLISVGYPLWSSSPQFLPTTPAETALKQAVGSSAVGFGNSDCIFPPANGLRQNINVAYGVQEFAVYDPITPLDYFSSWKAASGESGGYPQTNIFCPAVTSARLARLYGLSFVLEPAHSPGPSGAVFDRFIGTEQLYRIPGGAIATLNPLSPTGALPSLDALGAPVAVHKLGPTSWTVYTDATSAQVLRLRLTDVPGWKASLDGRPLRLESYSGIMMQAVVPPGRHVIRLTYWPTAFSIGIVIAALSALGLMAAVLASRLMRRRSTSPVTE